MTLANMSTLLAEHRAVGAFNFVQLELAQAIVAGAEEAGTGVVLQLSQNAVRFHGALGPAASAALELAHGARVPVVVHLDHATDEDLVDAALAAGVRSVMFDGAHLPDDENVARTRAVADRAHAAGAWVEAELGEVGGKGGAHTPGVRTDVEDAAAFVAATGVDALAVAVGSSHAMTERAASLDEDLISRLAARVPVPLVLHGSSGVPDAGIDGAIGAGMRKINIGTHLNVVFTGAVREALAADPAVVDPRTYVRPARDAVAREVARMLRLIVGGTGEGRA
ncbi:MULTISPECIES: class II fructose-bisphosphate aldolase [Microbacterium]|uniref:Class II fructose-bisphosphate aldolase n=1 Tax=Microbacterium wangchenii TaxID=2541726 RepID=A0ABX5SVD3_9MICO|nr:class II fructose-bisphosphate aldolase family protein [Microbacterium sp. EYE_512]QBR90143.1 class II fructose-bisphosphate aldolase [Microbacterium wangchenii]TXK11841.1 class II fructose-bisphosphate aldolase [Microbacterium wangchenii]